MLTKEGIIIKTNKYQESSKLTYVLTKEGLNTYLVRNANSFQSKNFSYSQEFSKIAFESSRKNSFEIITQGKVVKSYINIKNDSFKIFDVYQMFEIIYHLSEHMNDIEILYDFIGKILDIIEERSYSHFYLLIFKIKLLYLLGIAPELSRCSICGKDADLFGLELINGTSYCKKCFNLSSTTISSTIYKMFKFLYLTKIEYITQEVIDKIPDVYDELNKFIDLYYEHYLGYKSKTSKVINKINKV